MTRRTLKTNDKDQLSSIVIDRGQGDKSKLMFSFQFKQIIVELTVSFIAL